MTRSALRLRTLLVGLLMAAVTGFWCYFHFAAPGSMYRSFSADPEMSYFLESLAVFKGHTFTFVQHPGTPLAVLGTVLLALTYPLVGRSPEALIDYHLRHPALFMTLAHGLLLAGTLVSIRLLARLVSVRRWPDALLAAAVPASFFASSPQAFFSVVYWSHNSFAFPAGAPLMAALLIALRRDDLRTPVLSALGLAAGALAAVQLYFATWTLGLAAGAAAAAWPRGPRPALRAAAVVGLSAVAGFAVASLPLWPHHEVFLRFVGAVLSHQGIYGTGAPGFTSWSQWAENMRGLWSQAPALFAWSAAALSALVAAQLARTGRRIDRGPRLAGLAAAVSWTALLVLIGKHPSRFYMPALAALLPVLLAAAFLLWRGEGRTARTACVIASLAVFAGCAANGLRALSAHRQRVAFREAMESEVRRYFTARAAPGPGGSGVGFVLWGMGMGDTRCYPLWVGNYYVPGALTAEIMRACPNDGIFWPLQTVLPPSAEGPGVVITTDAAAAQFSALAGLAPPELSQYRGPGGVRLAFYRVAARGGRLVAQP